MSTLPDTIFTPKTEEPSALFGALFDKLPHSRGFSDVLRNYTSRTI
ncbi:Hypothetical protein CulFRC58_1491 [Corynebacterium ulcerans FRC58]|uniref:Transposase n=1 Tax=Corynebacterium ulcerans FRC58 TaxID=1408268 RepID=A0ABN4GUZ7_CORUL|nr:Hypothetical protein CulFRC58_1491 [Corynebacterium ulcerans FRC58]